MDEIHKRKTFAWPLGTEFVMLSQKRTHQDRDQESLPVKQTKRKLER
jgi:hypothetical protein